MSNVAQFPSGEPGKAKAFAVTEQKIREETVVEYLKTFGYDQILSGNEAGRFIQTALACNLDPFKREIYIAVYGDGENRKVSILTGYQVYLKRAERTGKLDGWRAWIDGTGEDMKAVVEIFRKDWSNSFTHEAYWPEAVQKKKDGYPSSFWVKQPRFQLRKVAIAQAFRLAFPDELGGLPYETAELPENDAAAPAVPDTVTLGKPGPYAALAEEALANNGPSNETAPARAEPETAPAAAVPGRRKPDDAGDRDKLIRKIEDLFEAHPEDFTQKHMDWIINTARKAPDRAGVLKMVAYTEKVIRKGLTA
jgi:phage recombination protein Bet